MLFIGYPTVDAVLLLLIIVYGFLVMGLFIYGVNLFYLTYLADKPSHEPPLPHPIRKSLPVVTVQLPIFNEPNVAERLIHAVARFDYPNSLLEIQVLDDSIDETVDIIAQVVSDLRKRGVDIVHIHRSSRMGFKAGALAEGTLRAKGQFIAIFDADFIPPKDFLRRAIPYFDDPSVGFVQARWGHLNPEYSLLTRLQSISIDGHFMIEQNARSRHGLWFNFNGSAGVWRKMTIEMVGGWQATTLTEDLDLSYRAWMSGWRAVFVPDLVAPAELPVDFSAYRRQQHRWARGNLECAIRYIPVLLRKKLSLKIKFEAAMHLSGYGVHLILFLVILIYPFLLLFSYRYPVVMPLLGMGVLFNITAIAPTIFFAAAQRKISDKWWLKLPHIFLLSAIGAGMMLNTVQAAMEILFKQEGFFNRTPKYGLTTDKAKNHLKPWPVRVPHLVFLELALAGYALFTAIGAFWLTNWVILFYSALFSIGLFYVALATLHETLLKPWIYRLTSSHRGKGITNSRNAG